MGSGLFTKAYIVASRSPNSKKKARPESDWDFYFVSKKPNTRIPSLRLTNQLHGDVVIYHEDDIGKIGRNDLVEIYPTDNYGIISDDVI